MFPLTVFQLCKIGHVIYAGASGAPGAEKCKRPVGPSKIYVVALRGKGFAKLFVGGQWIYWEWLSEGGLDWQAAYRQRFRS